MTDAGWPDCSIIQSAGTGWIAVVQELIEFWKLAVVRCCLVVGLVFLLFHLKNQLCNSTTKS